MDGADIVEARAFPRAGAGWVPLAVNGEDETVWAWLRGRGWVKARTRSTAPRSAGREPRPLEQAPRGRSRHPRREEKYQKPPVR
jgi:hypothetical protein